MSSFDNSQYLVEVFDKDFQSTGDFVKKFNPRKRVTLVMFFAPWCGHCVAMKPDYENVAFQLKDKNCTIAKFNSTLANNSKKMQTFTKYQIPGFPMLVTFIDGQFLEVYQGSRKASDIVGYVLQKIVQLQNNTAIFSTSMF